MERYVHTTQCTILRNVHSFTRTHCKSSPQGHSQRTDSESTNNTHNTVDLPSNEDLEDLQKFSFQ